MFFFIAPRYSACFSPFSFWLAGVSTTVPQAVLILENNLEEALEMAEHNHVVNKEGEVALNKVDDALNRIDDSKKDDILGSFDSFKSYLSDKIEMAQKIGLNEEVMAKAAEKIAGYLAAKEEPRNSEEKLL